MEYPTVQLWNITFIPTSQNTFQSTLTSTDLHIFITSYYKNSKKRVNYRIALIITATLSISNSLILTDEQHHAHGSQEEHENEKRPAGMTADRRTDAGTRLNWKESHVRRIP